MMKDKGGFGRLCLRRGIFSAVDLITADQRLGAAYEFVVRKWFGKVIVAAA